MRSSPIPLFLLGALAGIFVLAPRLLDLVAWLEDTWASLAGIPHVCDGGSPPPHEPVSTETPDSRVTIYPLERFLPDRDAPDHAERRERD